jgi:hypothetical protein
MKSKHLFLVVLTFMASVFVDRADAAVFTVFAAVHSVGCNQVLNTGISVTPNPPGTAGLMLSINADRNDLWKNDPTPPWFSNADGLGNPFGPSLGTLTVTPTGGSSFSFLFPPVPIISETTSRVRLV